MLKNNRNSRVVVLMMVVGAMAFGGCAEHATGPGANHAPRIDRVWSQSGTLWDSTRVIAGEVVQLQASVSDPDGDRVTCYWTTDRGSLSKSEGLAVEFVAPSAGGNATIQLMVTDGGYSITQVIVILVEIECQKRRIDLDARDDFLLDTYGKIVSGLVPGEVYTVTVSAPGVVHAPMQGVGVMYQESTPGNPTTFDFKATGESFQFRPIANDWQLGIFYVDWSTVADNSGTIVVDITGPTTQQVTIDAKDDAILLDDFVSIVGDLNPGVTHTVTVSHSDSPVHAPMQGVFVMYQESTTGSPMTFKYVDAGESFPFQPINNSWQFAAFCVDWSTTSDNSGVRQVFVVEDCAGPVRDFFAESEATQHE